MGFAKKIILGVTLLVAVAASAVFLLGSSDEKAIERLVETGAKAAEKGDAEGVIALLSRSYQAPGQDYDAAAQRIRREISPQRNLGQIQVQGISIQVNGPDASVQLRVRARAGPYALGEMGFSLKLRKEEEGWKVTSAEEIR
jgi:hypothetical protein